MKESITMETKKMEEDTKKYSHLCHIIANEGFQPYQVVEFLIDWQHTGHEEEPYVYYFRKLFKDIIFWERDSLTPQRRFTPFMEEHLDMCYRTIIEPQITAFMPIWRAAIKGEYFEDSCFEKYDEYRMDTILAVLGENPRWDWLPSTTEEETE